MSSVASRAGVHFSSVEIPLNDRSLSDRYDSVSSRYSSNECLTPRSILKASPVTDSQYDLTSSASDKMLQGMARWVKWRTKVNDSLVDVIEERHRIFSYPGSIRHLRKYRGIMKNLVEPEFLIGRQPSDCALQRAVYDHVTGRNSCHLEPSTFICFGIPRVHLKTNAAYSGDESRSRRDSGSTGQSSCTPTKSSAKSESSGTSILSESVRRDGKQD